MKNRPRAARQTRHRASTPTSAADARSREAASSPADRAPGEPLPGGGSTQAAHPLPATVEDREARAADPPAPARGLADAGVASRVMPDQAAAGVDEAAPDAGTDPMLDAAQLIGEVLPPGQMPASRHVDVVALALALERLPEVRSVHGLELLIEMRAQAERGQRPLTLGEALEFMIYRRGLSPAGSKKVMRQLIRQNLLIPAHSPCIDKAKDLLASRRLMCVFPIVARPYTVFRISSEGELQRKKFDTAYLAPSRLDPADVRLSQWLRLWLSAIRPGDDVPRSLTPFF